MCGALGARGDLSQALGFGGAPPPIFTIMSGAAAAGEPKRDGRAIGRQLRVSVIVQRGTADSSSASHEPGGAAPGGGRSRSPVRAEPRPWPSS